MEPEVCVLFSGTTMGSIIGKGGSVINNLRANTGSFLKAFPNKLQNSDERVLLVRGDADKIISCVSEIYGKFRNCITRSLCDHFNYLVGYIILKHFIL